MTKKSVKSNFKFSHLLPTGIAKIVIGKTLYHKFHFIPRRPPIVVIELTNHCNLRCIMCEHQNMKRKKMNIDTDLAKKVLQECADWGVRRVIISRLGEPLIHPDIIELISFAKKAGIPLVSMVCNAMLLDEGKAREIISAGLDLISFSVDAASKDTFERIRSGASFTTVTDNITRFIRIRDSLSLQKPWVEINTCLMQECIDEIPLLIEMWEPLVNRIKIWPVAPLPQSNGQMIVGPPKKSGEKRACDILWTRLVVLSNGQATVCCGDREGTLSVGNAKDSTIKELWNSKEIDRIRNIHFQKNFRELPLCEQCFLTDENWFESEKKIIKEYEKKWKPLGFLPSSFFS